MRIRVAENAGVENAGVDSRGIANDGSDNAIVLITSKTHKPSLGRPTGWSKK